MGLAMTLAVAGMVAAAPASAAVGLEIYGSGDGAIITQECDNGACFTTGVSSTSMSFAIKTLVPDNVFSTPFTEFRDETNPAQTFFGFIRNEGMGRLSAISVGVINNSSGGIANFTGTQTITSIFAATAFARQIEVSAVPEPSTWALMLAGFGLVGSSMRRRRHRIVTNHTPKISATA